MVAFVTRRRSTPLAPRDHHGAPPEPPGGGVATTTQSYEGAFPGTRHLQLIRALGDNAVVGSACPKVLDQASPDYGYRPTTRALAARLAKAFNP